MSTSTRCDCLAVRLWRVANYEVAGRIALLLLLPFGAPGGGVVTNCTEANLRAAMAGGGTVTFACDGVVTLAGTVTNSIDTTLNASGRSVIISGSQAVRVFCVETNATLTLANLTIADGRSLGGSAILNLGGNVNLSAVTLRSNTATLTGELDQTIPQASGGAIFNRGGKVQALNCTFAGNIARSLSAETEWAHEQVYGGAIRNEVGQVDLRSCAFLDNRAAGGPSLNITISPGNGDPGMGGAIYNSGTLTADLCAFTRNSAVGGAGLGDVLGRPGWSASEGCGGAIYNSGTLMVDRTTFSSNTATGGAGGHGSRAFDLSGQLKNGYAGGDGGAAKGVALFNFGSLSLHRSTLAGNVVTGGNGGNGGGGSNLESEFGGNGGSGGQGSPGLGGAVFNRGSATLVNCSVALNTGQGGTGASGGTGAWGNHRGGNGGAGGSGGSGFAGVEGTCNLTNCTLAWNQGQGGAGGAGGAGGESYEIPGSPGPNGAAGAAWGGTICGSLANSLIASNTPAGNDSFTDPKLGPLAANGGPTLTMALLPGSPAIDSGAGIASLFTDQRGLPRPAGAATDIGAYEFGSVMPTVGIAHAGGLNLNIVGYGNTGRVCRLQASTDLLHWVNLATNYIGSNGTALFNDNSGTGAYRFYRLVMP